MASFNLSRSHLLECLAFPVKCRQILASEVGVCYIDNGI
jgi:hypothetical protein